MPNKNGKILSLYWFAILFIVAGAVFYMVINFYGKPVDVRPVESAALTNKIADCLSEKGYLREDILGNADFDFLKTCSLNFDVEDFSEWKQFTQYYTEFSINKFDGSVPNSIGENLFNNNSGNPNLKTDFLLEKTKERKKERKVDFVVIHYTEGADAQGAIDTLEARGYSVHYMIDKDGTVYSKYNTPSSSAFKYEEEEAIHAGCKGRPLCHSDNEKPNASKYAQDADCCRRGVNAPSIGIELVNLGDKCNLAGQLCDGVEKNGKIWEKFPEAQIDSLVQIVSGIVTRYDIPIDREHIIGHDEINSGGSIDPGPLFPWSEFISKIKRIEETDFWAGKTFYAIDKNNNQYVVSIFSIIGKKEKNER